MDENHVIDAVCHYLRESGYEISQRLHTTQQGVDIVAKNRTSNLTLQIEAKGGTSSQVGSARFGKPYTSSQVFDRVAKGFYTVCQMLSEAKSSNSRVALAVPDTYLFRKYLSAIKPIVRNLGVGVLLVSESRKVSEF
jgi:Holliday junction resolvase-like predicted endonuclease